MSAAKAWTCLEGFNKEHHCHRLILTGNNTFITLSFKGIMEYNISHNEWTQIMKYPDNYKLTDYADYTYDLNKKQQILYIYNRAPGYGQYELIKVDLNNNKWEFNNVQQDFGCYPKAIIINNQFNIIGGSTNNKHLVWNDDTKRFEELHEFHEFCDGYFFSADIVHIKSKKMVLLFGGTNSTNYCKLGIIYKYDTVKKEWNKLMATMPEPFRVNFGVTSIMNGKYVLFFGGFSGPDNDEIFIFSLSTQTFIKSKKKCPKKGIFKAITINDNKKNELTVFGFMRKEWNLCEISENRFPPLYLLKLIESWYYTGITYLMGINSGKHWKINTLDLFQ